MFENLVPPVLPPIVLQWWQRLDTVAAWIAAGAAVVALALVIYQVSLQREQARQAKRQTEIIEKQDELMGRRARLEFKPRIRPRTMDFLIRQDQIRVEFRIHNTGSKGAANYYWHLYFPRVWPYEWEGGKRVKLTHKAEMYFRGDDSFTYFAGYVSRPLYHTRSAVIGSMTIPRMRLPFRIDWQVVCEDGAFPGEEAGSIEVLFDPGALQKDGKE